MLLRQPADTEWDDIEHPNDLVIDWDGADDIPADWKATVERCLAEVPNQRPDLERIRTMARLGKVSLCRSKSSLCFHSLSSNFNH